MRSAWLSSACRSLSAAAIVFTVVAGCRSAAPPPPQITERVTRVVEGVTFPADASLLFLNPDQQRVGYRNVQNIVPTTRVSRGRSVWPLTPRPIEIAGLTYEFGGATYTLDDFFAKQNVAGLLVLRGNDILVERYAQGHSASSVWTSFSMAKSVVSMLFGIAVRDGAIRSIDDRVTDYVPALRGSAYDAVTLRHLLQMASGIDWNEEESDRTSDLGNVARASREGIDSVVKYMATRPRKTEPGTVFNYNTGDTFLAGAVLRNATGKSLGEYLSEKVWKPAGMEADGHWMLMRQGDVEYGGCCISATLRDFGRLGLLMLRGGKAHNGRQIVPAAWVAESTAASPTAPFYGMLWWRDRMNRYYASGSFGQFIKVDPQRDTVVVVESFWPAAYQRPLAQERDAFVESLLQKIAPR